MEENGKEGTAGAENAEIKAVEAENRRRNLSLEENDRHYNPLTGERCAGWGAKSGSLRRWRISQKVLTGGRVEYIPDAMHRSEEYTRLLQLERALLDGKEGAPDAGALRLRWQRLRCREDFEYWAATCVKIKDKRSPRLVPFLLNRPQRRVLAMMEGRRVAGEPVRMIMLKARQWGGSTLVQMYMAWIQCTRLRNWNSIICAQVARAAATIRGMYSTMLANYPQELWEGDESPRLVRFEGQESVREITGRRCTIALGSSEKQDAIRGGDYAMAHLTEVAFWKDSPQSTPASYVRSICGGIADGPDTLIVYESTANGIGNFFHSEWVRSQRGESDNMAVFVPWHEIEMYTAPVPDVARLWRSMDAYERGLWEQGVTLEAIAWYHRRRRAYADHQSMQAEYPSDATEAFANTGNNVFSTEAVARMVEGCVAPLAVGEIVASGGALTGPAAMCNTVFTADTKGALKLWEHPEPGVRYVVAVDVGGRSRDADWSVIAVLAAGVSGARVVAQWRGHIDHDLLTWKAAAIASHYGRALLVFESNTLETEAPAQGEYILHELLEHYPNLYLRPACEGGSLSHRPGFHTNRATKQMIITELIATVRDGLYVERDADACGEFSVYEQLPNGSYGARRGYHDDILMTRAIGLHALSALDVNANAEVVAFYRR